MSSSGSIFFQEGRLKHEFEEEFEPIGSGTFGIVTKAKHKVDHKYYAIKKIRIKEDNYDRSIKELQIWAQLDCDYFVQYRSSWVESSDEKAIQQFKSQSQHNPSISPMETDQGKDYGIFAILHIQMDLCAISLDVALQQLKAYFNIVNIRQCLPPMGYYISSELFVEILEAIDYLHGMTPPIMHRDIKPNNILIRPTKNGKFVKVSDFGLAAAHLTDQSHSGFPPNVNNAYRYMAPEMKTDQAGSRLKYTPSVDFYSIAVMAEVMFNVDIQGSTPLNNKYQSLKNLIVLGMSVPESRRSCKQWLFAKNQWALGFKDVLAIEMLKVDVNQNYDIKRDFVQFFIKTKIQNNINL